MKKIILVLFFVLLLLQSKAQKLEQLINKDTATYINTLNAEQLLDIYTNHKIKDTAWYLQHLFLQMPSDSFKVSKLPFGTYLTTTIIEHTVKYTLQENMPFNYFIKIINDDVVLFLQDKKNKNEIENAKVNIGNNAMPYDSGYGGYAIAFEKIKTITNKILLVNYATKPYALNCVFGEKNKVPTKENRRNSNISAGYCITDKPVYKLKDTLKIKSYLLKYTNGKPLHKKVNISITEPTKNFTYTTTIKPTSAGAYQWEWAIPDTLAIDKNYTITLSYTKHGKVFEKKSNFYVEDYTLAKNKLNVNFPKSIFYEGEDMSFTATATDANNFPLNGVMLSYTVKLQNIQNVLKDSFVLSEKTRNNLFTKDTILPYNRNNTFTIPSSVLPMADANYRINITLTDPITFEQKTFTTIFTKIRQSENVLLYQKADSSFIQVLYNGRDTNRKLTLIGMFNNDTIFIKKIQTPYALQLPTNTSKIIAKDEKGKVYSTSIFFNKLEITNYKALRTGDSVHFSFAYPFPNVVHYKIFKNKEVIKSGEARNIKMDIKDNGESDYTLQFTNNVYDNFVNNFFSIKIVSPAHIIQLKNNLPATAFPGQQVPVEITATDYHGKALRKINIASYAQNEQFGNRIQLPSIIIPEQFYDRTIIEPVKDNGNIFIRNDIQAENYAITKRHIQQLNLYKNEWYQLHYPSATVSSISIPTQHEQAEFCVVIVSDKNLFTPKYIKLNGEYIYINDVNESQKYSLLGQAKNNKLDIRYFMYNIHLQAFDLKNYSKKIIIINADSLQFGKNNSDKIIALDSMPVASPTLAEKESMLQSIALVDINTPLHKNICTEKTKDGVYITKTIEPTGTIQIGEDKFWAVGPVASASTISITAKKTYNLHKGLQVNYYNDLLKEMETRNYSTSISEQLFNFLESQISEQRLLQKLIDDTIVPQPQKANTQYSENVDRETNEKTIEENYYQSYHCTPTEKKFTLFIQNNNDSIYAKSIWFINPTNPKNSDFIRFTQRTVRYSVDKYVDTGKIDIYVLLNNNRIILLPTFNWADQDHLYINPTLLQNKPTNESDLQSAMNIYTELISLPMNPFFNAPIELKNVAQKTINKNRQQVYVKGTLTNAGESTIENALVFAEINGKFVSGATSNANGDFEFLDLAPATYSFKIYANNFAITHLLPSSYLAGNDYTINLQLKPIENQTPMLQAVNKDFRLMCFADKNISNIMKLQLYDYQTREPIAGSTFTIEQEDKKTITASINKQSIVPFVNNEEEATITIKKEGYYPIQIQKVRFVKDYYYTLELFLQKIKPNQVALANEYEIDMRALLTLNKRVKPIAINHNNKAGEITGKVLDEKGEALEAAKVAVYNKNGTIGGAHTDNFGSFTVKPLSNGVYTVKASYLGYITEERTDVMVSNGQTTTLKFNLNIKTGGLMSVVIKSKYKAAIIDAGKPSQDYRYHSNDYSSPNKSTESKSSSYTSQQIERLASTSTIDAAALRPGVYQMKNGDNLNLGGGRSSNTVYMIDGILVSDASRAVLIPGNNNGIENLLKVNSDEEMEISLEQNLQTIAMDSSLNKTRNKFSDVAYWQPNVITNKEGKATFTITLPDNITSYKAQTIAMGKHFLHGTLSQDIAIYKPLQTLSVLPRFLYQGDSILAKANFVNLTHTSKNVSVYASINNKNVYHDSISLVAQKDINIVLQPTGTDSIRWQAGMQYGSAYKDAEYFALPTFSSAMQSYTNQSITMNKDSEYVVQIPANTKGTITFNNILHEKILNQISELKKYEYNCVEQTTSKLKAMLYEKNILQAMGKHWNNDDSVYLLIKKLKEYQNTDNTWGWWRKQNTNWRISLYVIDVLYTASANGFTNSAYTTALQKIKDNYQNLNTSDKLYAMYILQKTDNWTTAIENNLHRINANELNTTDQLYFYKIKNTLGDSIALNTLYTLFIKIKSNSQRRYFDNFFYDPNNEIYTAYSLFNSTSLQEQFMQVFENNLRNSSVEKNQNTFAKASMIEALALKSKDNNTTKIISTLLINDTLRVNTFPYVLPITNRSYKIKHEGAEVFCNTAESVLIENPILQDSIFAIETHFENKDKTSQIKAGTPVTLTVQIKAYRTAQNVMVEIPLPSGMQIINKKEIAGQYIQYFKHKIVVFYNEMKMGNVQLQFALQPNFKGTCSLPASKVCLMYYPYIFGCNENKKVVIE